MGVGLVLPAAAVYLTLEGGEVAVNCVSESTLSVVGDPAERANRVDTTTPDRVTGSTLAALTEATVGRFLFADVGIVADSAAAVALRASDVSLLLATVIAIVAV